MEHDATAKQMGEFERWKDQLSNLGIKLDYPEELSAEVLEEKLGFINDFIGETQAMDDHILGMLEYSELPREPTSKEVMDVLPFFFWHIYEGKWDSTTEELVRLLRERMRLPPLEPR